MLPALEGDIILNDRASQPFDQIAAKAARANQALTGSQRAVEKLVNHLSMLNVEAKGGSFFDNKGSQLGITDIISKLPAGVGKGASSIEELAENYSNYVTTAKMATEETERFGDSFKGLGEANLTSFTSRLDVLREKTDDLAKKGDALEAAKPKKSTKLLDQEVDFAGMSRKAAAAIPGFSPMEGQMMAKVFEILPAITVRTALFAGALGVLAGAGIGAAVGLDAVWQRMQSLEVQGNLKQKIGVTFETDDVDAAIEQVQNDLDNRLSEEKVMQVLLQVDPTGALSDLDKFGELAAVVQGFADSFGRSWEESFTGIAEAIEAGNGQYLEQVGAIGSADGAFVTYAKSIGKTVNQLTPLERQQALYNATVQNLGKYSSGAVSGVDQLRDATDKSKAAFADAKTAFGNWVVALLDPSASGMATWWAQKLETMTAIIGKFEEQLTQGAGENRTSAKLSGDDAVNFDALRGERDNINAQLVSERANLNNAEGRGDTRQVAQIEANLDRLQARLEQVKEAIAQAQDNAESGIPISPVVSGNKADTEALSGLEAQRNAIIAEIKTTQQAMVDAGFAKDNDQYYQLVADLDALEARLETITTATAQARDNALKGVPIAEIGPQAATGEVLKIQAEYTSKLKEEQNNLVLSTLALKQAQEKLYPGDFAAAFNAGDTETVDKSAASITNATALKAEAEARFNLLTAEQAYLVSMSQLKTAQREGNDEMIARAEANAEAAQTTLELAQQQAVATFQFEAYSESVARVGNAFDQVKAVASTAGTDLVPVDNWTAAIDSFRAGLTANPLVVPTVLGPPSQGEQPVATLPVGNGGKTRFDDDTAATTATQANTEAMQLATAASSALLAAKAALAVATREEKAAQDELVASQASGTASQQQSAASAAQAANSKKVSAAAGVAASLAEYEAAKAALLSASALTINAQANGDSAAANIKNAAATERNADALQRTAQVAGMAVDAVSGLPVAFNSAELNAKQLEAALVDLEIQLMNIEAAAANVGFSIAQRLVPSMGIGGAIGQGTEWAGQARDVREQFESINDARLSQGDDPLGAQVLDTAMSALTDNWQAYATDATAAMDTVGGAGKDHAKEMEQVTDQINDALDGMVRGVLKDSTSGLIDLDSLLPRVDAVDENARRMADVAVKGFQSPWYEGLKGMFSPDVFAGGEAAVKTAAANMVREHQKGLSTMLFDADAAAQQVFEQIQAKQKTDEFVAQIREKVKELGVNVEGFDIKNALGIELNEDDVAAKAGGAARKSALSQVLSFEQIIEQMKTLGQETESPIVGLLEPKEEANEKIAATGKDAIAKVGDAMVTQASEGKYGERSITAIVTQLKTQEVQLKATGVTLADWMGTSMITRFESAVPTALLDILVTNLIPLMVAQAAVAEERTSSTRAN